MTYFIENDLTLSIFLILGFTLICWLVLAAFHGFLTAINWILFGIFKRPLPDHHEQYFDVNCINSMNLADFLQPNQVTRCRPLRHIDRPGPPRF